MCNGRWLFSKRLLKLFRITPNIRIKFGKELKDNLNRKLSTSYPHSDAWLEGPWGMNCFIPLFGDTKKNNLRYHVPKSKFSDQTKFQNTQIFKFIRFRLKTIIIRI